MADDSGGDASDRRVELEAIDPLSLDEALAIVGERTRAAILVELGEAQTTDPSAPDALGYSELMDRVGARDSGRFNYHLDKLVGPFVKKRDDGYALRLPGRRVYEAIVAGTLTERETVDPFEVGDCPRCGDALSAAYHPDHLLTVECTGCGTLFDAAHLPARAVADRSTDDLLRAAYQRRHHKLATMRRGVCQACGAVVDRGLEPSASVTYGDASVDEMAGLDVYAVLECRGCGTSLVGHPTNVALTTPVVVGFFAEHDRDAALARWWRDPVASARSALELREDPVSVRVPFDVADERLTVVLDDDLAVADASRTVSQK